MTSQSIYSPSDQGILMLLGSKYAFLSKFRSFVLLSIEMDNLGPFKAPTGCIQQVGDGGFDVWYHQTSHG